MPIDLVQANITALKITDKYQTLHYNNRTIPVPYFINTAEQQYKKAMEMAELEDETTRKIVSFIKEGQTALGAFGGKGSPEELQQDIDRLIPNLKEWGYNPQDDILIRKWLATMHIGLDCAGYVFNILKAIELDQKVDIISLLAWADPEKIKPSHAGVFIFDSEKFEEIPKHKLLRPLDLAVFKDHSHVGIIIEKNRSLCIADCSMKLDGITVKPLETRSTWAKRVENGEVVFRRLPA